MTDGTSQGLFFVVAIVIFGIFVSLSYTVFGSMSDGLTTLFDNSIQQVSLAVTNPLAIEKTDNKDGTYTLVAYNRNSDLDIVDMTMTSKVENQNLIRNSDFTQSLEDASINYGIDWHTRGSASLSIDDSVEMAYDNPALRIDTEEARSKNDFYTELSSSLDVGDVVTVSFYAKANREAVFGVRFGRSTGGYPPTTELTLGTELERYEVTLTREQSHNRNIIFETEDYSTVWMSNIQVEYGTRATDWSPFALDNEYHSDRGYLSMTVENKGIYEFSMTDSEGNVYTNDIRIR